MLFQECSLKNVGVAGYVEAFQICAIGKADKYSVQLFKNRYTRVCTVTNMMHCNKSTLDAYCIRKSDMFPFLTVGKNKNGRKASKIKLCSRFLFRNDMCYIFVLGKFIILVSLIMPRIVDFLMNS